MDNLSNESPRPLNETSAKPENRMVTLSVPTESSTLNRGTVGTAQIPGRSALRGFQVATSRLSPAHPSRVPDSNRPLVKTSPRRLCMPTTAKVAHSLTGDFIFRLVEPKIHP
jgi:hypothetical protein